MTRKSNLSVDQLTDNNEVVVDFGEILSPKELTNILINTFIDVTEKDGLLYGKYQEKEYCLYYKNISYLGHPHPIFKKRIQIPMKFRHVYEINKKKGIQTLLIGIYKYKGTLLFCDFDTQTYIHNKINNSSAHVYTIDLINGKRHGIFTKQDFNGNVITVFDDKNIEEYLTTKLLNSKSCKFEIFDTLDSFFDSIAKEWYGIQCYQEMITDDFNNKFQPEWPAFYLEYKLNKYITDNKKDDIVFYNQNKKKGQVDLDLYFPKLEFYGDLKAHSISSGGIQGNDYDTVVELIKEQSIYYVVCDHSTEKDKDHNYEVTTFWNMKQNKKNLKSYSKKMKHSVRLEKYYVLELNKYNKKYLSMFYQGKNSDGKPRNPKIMINKKNIDNFLIHTVKFNEVLSK